MINSCEEIKLEVVNTNRYRDGGTVGIDVMMVDREVSGDLMISPDYRVLFISERIEFRLPYSFSKGREEGVYINYQGRQQPGRFYNVTILRLLLQAVTEMSDVHIRDLFMNEIKKELREQGINELTK
jgi:hypothetical protein